jgi:hypothetical protein
MPPKCVDSKKGTVGPVGKKGMIFVADSQCAEREGRE